MSSPIAGSKVGTVLLLSLPVKTFVGINLSTFSSSPNFHGVTNISPGIHFLYTGTDASLSIRQGHWLRIPSTSQTRDHSTTHVFKWNADIETLDLLLPESLDAQNAIRGVQSLSRGLVDYTALREASVKLQKEQENTTSKENTEEGEEPEEVDIGSSEQETDPWITLTTHVSARLLRRILSRTTTPGEPGSNNLDGSSSSSFTLTSVSTSPLDTETIPGLSQDETDSMLNPTQTLHLLPVDLKKTWDESDLGSTRTQRARDRSWYLQHLISHLQKQESNSKPGTEQISQQIAATDLLGELQFTFLMVLCLANYSCLEQWKRLLTVVLTCQAALVEVEGFFVEVVAVLRAQLGRVEDVEGGLFEMGDEVGSAWLRRLLRGFREHVDDAGAAKLKVELTGLESWLRETYQWADEKNVLRRGMVQLEDGEMVELQDDDVDEDEETGEYAPVVVEM